VTRVASQAACSEDEAESSEESESELELSDDDDEVGSPGSAYSAQAIAKGPRRKHF
jgi:hypothetical protein